MRDKLIPLDECLRHPDGRVALGENGWFRPVAAWLSHDGSFILLQVDSKAGAPITIWFNIDDARSLGEELISITL